MPAQVNSPKISIITVCLNAASVIEKCLRSVRSQTYKNIEFLVLDGASNDGTVEILEAHRDCIAFLDSRKDEGIYWAMNAGLQKATGDFVLFLGADDYLCDDKVIEDVVNQMKKESADFYYGLLEVRYLDGRVEIYDAGKPENIGELMMLGCLPSQSCFIKREAFTTIGPFDTQYKISADYDWYLKALCRPDFRFAKIDRLCGSYFHGGVSSVLENCRPEVNLIQNRSSFYQTEAWQKRLIEAWQKDSLFWRLERDQIEKALESKRRDAKVILEDKVGMLEERAHLLQEVDRLRKGVDALEAERTKLQRHLDAANNEVQKLIAQNQESSQGLRTKLKRSLKIRFGALRRRPVD